MPFNLLKSLAQKSGKSLSDLEKLWDKALKIAKTKLPQSSESFYPYAVGILKKMTKVTENKETEFVIIKDKLYYKTTSGNWESSPKGYFLLRKRHPKIPAAANHGEIVALAKKLKLVKFKEAYDDLNTPYRIRQEPKNSASKIFKRDEYLRDREEKDKERQTKLKKVDTKLSEILNKLK